MGEVNRIKGGLGAGSNIDEQRASTIANRFMQEHFGHKPRISLRLEKPIFLEQARGFSSTPESYVHGLSFSEKP